MADRTSKTVTNEAPKHLTYETDDMKVEFADVGRGVAVMVPEWRSQALVLERHDLRTLHAMIGAVIARP